jgi:hypothetical protein
MRRTEKSRRATLESAARSRPGGRALEWYGRRFRVEDGEAGLAVPVSTFAVGGTPRVVWRADLDTSLERFLDRMEATEEDARRVPRSRLS